MKQHTVMTPYMVGEVHFYTTEIDGELVLFDTGPPTAAAVAELERSVDLKNLKHLFVTHCHVDHYGLAAYIERHSAAQIYLPRNDVHKLRRIDEWMPALLALLDSAGFDLEFCRSLQHCFEAETVALTPTSFTITEESPEPARLGISLLPCPGHSPSDLVFVHDNEAVTGDTLLRDLFQSPLLSPDSEDFSRHFRNYDAYCGSLAKLATLRGLTILPAHREGVRGVDDTIVFYVRKLLERGGQVKRFAELETVREVIERIFGSALANPVLIYLKVSEIYFMRDFLADPLRLRRALEQIGLFDKVRELFDSVAGS
jgi:hydroxyacylglutathione hydrolase